MDNFRRGEVKLALNYLLNDGAHYDVPIAFCRHYATAEVRNYQYNPEGFKEDLWNIVELLKEYGI